MRQCCETCEFWRENLTDGKGECDQTLVPEPIVKMRYYERATATPKSEPVRYGEDDSGNLRQWVPVSESEQTEAVLVTPPDFYCASWQPRVARDED
jgi:hypothetical protein